MNRITLGICLYILFTLVSTGQGQKPSESSQEGSGLTTKSGQLRFFPWDYQGEGFYPKGKQWAVPIPATKTPIKISDYEPIGKNSIFDERSEATKLWRAANQVQGRHSKAEQMYLQALKLNPEFSHAAYQLACAYAIRDKPDKAKKFFDLACTLGFSDYPLCYRDPYLGPVRTTTTFPEKLKVIRAHYLADASQLVGTPVVFLPEGSSPDHQVPAIFLLHGKARTHEEHFKDARQWSKLGFIAIAMPGSIPHLYGSFMWSEESVEITHRQIQSILRHPLVSDPVNPKQVFVLGFSQGAAHAFSVVVLHPDQYAGAIPVSLGGGPRVTSEDHALSSESKPKIWFVFGELETGAKKYAETWTKVCQKFGWKCKVTQHPGGHHFPDDWDDIRPQIATFLMAKE